MENFIHLHVHTYYSLLDGQASIKKLVDKAVADGMKGMAVTDHGNMMGIKEFWNYCGKINKGRKKEGLEPFKPILGCEMYVAHRSLHDKDKEMGDNSGYHLIVLAKNSTGYHNLVKLVSHAWTEGYYYRPRTDRTELEKYHEGLIVCSACIAGEVPAKILKGDIEGAREACQWYHNLFGDDYYLELQRHEVTDPNQVANRETFPLQQKANKVLLQFAEEYGIKVICSNDSHFVDKENADAHDLLLCLATGKDLDDPDRMRYSKQEWFKTQQEMNDIFSDIPQALSNTLEILDKVEQYSIDHAPIMPNFPIPADFGTEEDTRKKFTEQDLFNEFTRDENGNEIMTEEEGKAKIEKLGGYDKLYRIKFEADYLTKLTYEGAAKCYPQPLAKDVDDRIRFELHIMKTMGFPGYFLIVQDFINAARNELGVLVGPGRGSAAGSVVAYCLGITKIDPLKYDLLFERFLNPDRISLPDIDTDFDDDGRGRVLDWVTEKYGADKVAHIITYGTMATKNSIKDVARVMHLPLEVSNRLAKLIPAKLPGDRKMTLPNVIECVPELKQAEVSTDPVLHDTIMYAKMLEGTVRNTGVHACGTIICRDAINDWVPVSTADDKETPGQKILCTQYDGHVIEETGLIKMDFLGLKTLSIIKEALNNVKLTTGEDIDIDHIPIDDPLTYKLYQEGRTVGTFQFESAGMQKYLRELQPTVFEDLIAMNALYRPGPMDNIPTFIARKKDPSLITYKIPCMEVYLKDTYGITVYQEQVMLLSRQLAGFTRGESDALRKAMGKKKKEIVDAMKPKFIAGGKERGHDPKVLEEIWSEWEKFASYAFNKSHATCYSWVAYQTGYLKAHYPAEYMAAVMSRNINEITEITKLMDECKNMGLKVLGPDVNESREKFSANKKGEVRFGIAGIKGTGGIAAEAIIKERDANGPYTDIYDLFKRVNLSTCNRKCFEGLALSGAFDSFGIKREQYFAETKKGQFLDALIKFGQTYQSGKQEAQHSLFGFEVFQDAIALPQPPQAESWSDIEKLNKEKELVGMYMSAHPLDNYSFIINNMCNMHCDELGEDKEELAKREELTFGGIITEVKTKISKTNKPCGFVTIEDFHGKGEIALFGQDWAKWESILKEGYTVFINAKCYKKFQSSDYYDFTLQRVQFLQDVKDKSIEKITIQVNASMLNDEMVNDISSLIQASPGNTKVFFKINDYEDQTNVTLESRLNGINIDRELINYIKECDALDYTIN